eukprot:gnl/Spiro4/29424_TR14414_c0_g1_i1.p1 gnl/Spiro4/29424_TR14414_c0_g1~~gnl/Spiro4/29424_TR14414_c0_g1_i1.p1  ORF type:complete len:746 (+),score=-75.95 gnl/Spiro4/29424_TR14414_c0_g1_i1:180-2417(+)
MRSEFDGSTGFFESTEGSARNMTMLYGLSDFWHLIFEDSEKIDLLFEANAIVASDIYSKFLQLTSTITLENIQINLGTQLKLILLSKADYVPGTVATYTLPDGLQDARYLTNRPFLATTTYEDSTDYFIDIEANTIQFAKDPFNDKFPRRINSAGYDEISIWAIDVQTDEKLMYNYYGKLIGVDPQESTERYKDFLYGLFYLYVHGPDLSMVRRGLNVALGVPLARDNETVLSIRKYPGSGQYFVITDLNSYILPFGLVPSVQEGDVLTVGDEVTTWVEVKDYVNDGDWWINLEVPKSLMPYVPSDQPDAYAKPGTYADYLMRNYLKHHTFLVKVNVTTFKNVQSFQQLGDIIKRIKPAYTSPIYIWSVPIDDEVVRFLEESTTTRRDSSRSDVFLCQIRRMRRNALDPLLRSNPNFQRISLGHHENLLLGLDTYANGIPTSLSNGNATGFINRSAAFKANTGYEKALMVAKFRRNERNVPHVRSMVAYTRNLVAPAVSGQFVDPWPAYKPTNLFSVPLYVTTLADIQDRFRSINVPVPEAGTAVFTLMQPYWTSGEINSIGIDEGVQINQYGLMVGQYSTIFNKGPKGTYIGNFMPDSAKSTYLPPVIDLQPTDYLLCTQIYEQVYAVYLITSSYAGSAKAKSSVKLVEDPDTLVINQANMSFTRGLGPAISSPAYMTRGGSLIVGGVPSVKTINTGGIDENHDGAPTTTLTFTDTVNLNMPRTRGSANINVNAVLGADMNPAT